MEIIVLVFLFLIVVVLVISTLHYKNLSEKDGATGCYTKDWAVAKRKNCKLVRMMREAKRIEEIFGFLFIDMDNFKEVNDEYGHVIGDNIIRNTVATIKDCLMKKDIVVRFGGDEFIVLLPYLTGKYALAQVAEYIRDRVWHNTNRTVSIGGTVFTPKMPINVEMLMTKADNNVYEAKKNGKDCVVIT